MLILMSQQEKALKVNYIIIIITIIIIDIIAIDK